jgi:hypothetical protein
MSPSGVWVEEIPESCLSLQALYFEMLTPGEIDAL